jgi:hypothetical protein
MWPILELAIPGGPGPTLYYPLLTRAVGASGSRSLGLSMTLRLHPGTFSPAPWQRSWLHFRARGGVMREKWHQQFATNSVRLIMQVHPKVA